MKSTKKTAPNELYALAFGLFLGLCILKFGDPVILDQQIAPPANLSELWHSSWPTHWACWTLVPLAVIGVGIMLRRSNAAPRRCPLWLLVLPLLWFGWQVISATQTVDADLTMATLWQFFGCVACYFLGAFLFAGARARQLLLAGVLAAFTVCLVRAIHQRIEYPQDMSFLLQSERMGWTNLPPDMVLDLKHDQTIITTNGADVLSPVFLAKLAKGRVMGTLFYPNSLAGIILLLLPVALATVFRLTKPLRPLVHLAAVMLVAALGTAALYWSGSKLGWLIAMWMAGLCLFRLEWSAKLKILTLAIVAVLGLGIFAVRFHNYFAHGATSAVARTDYWRAAVQTTRSYPCFGTGPGTFQRPYARLKSPDAEMARLAHNDYLEQFSDSGVPGGIVYCAWTGVALVFIARRLWKTRDPVTLALLLGLLGWFAQGLGEFPLYIPALAWTAFALLGCLVNSEDSPVPADRPKSIRQTPGPG